MKGIFPNLTQRKSLTYLIAILFSSYSAGYAQEQPLIIGARAWGLANATVARHDYLAMFNNPAGLAGIGQAVVLSSFDTYYGFEGINSVAAGIIVPVSEDLGMGIAVLKWGDNFYNEAALSFGAGHRIGKVSLGMKANYLQTAINIPSLLARRHSVVLDMGGIVAVTSKFSIGAHIFNVLQASYSGDIRYRAPTVLRAGFQYEPSEEVNLSAEFNKNTDQKIQFRAGLEYRFLKKLFLRTGIAAGPTVHYFGAGFAGKKLKFDYSANVHPALGISHHVSLTFNIWEGAAKVDKKP